MASLRAAPLTLTQGLEVVIKVLAKNAVGWGPESDPSSIANAKVQVAPLKPTSRPSRGSGTSQS